MPAEAAAASMRNFLRVRCGIPAPAYWVDGQHRGYSLAMRRPGRCGISCRAGCFSLISITIYRSAGDVAMIFWLRQCALPAAFEGMGWGGMLGSLINCPETSPDDGCDFEAQEGMLVPGAKSPEFVAASVSGINPGPIPEAKATVNRPCTAKFLDRF